MRWDRKRVKAGVTRVREDLAGVAARDAPVPAGLTQIRCQCGGWKLPQVRRKPQNTWQSERSGLRHGGAPRTTSQEGSVKGEQGSPTQLSRFRLPGANAAFPKLGGPENRYLSDFDRHFPRSVKSGPVAHAHLSASACAIGDAAGVSAWQEVGLPRPKQARCFHFHRQ